MFTWGRVIEEITVGDYSITKYHPYKSGTGRPKVVDESVIHYHVYVLGKDTNTSTLSLDSALIYAIAHKNIGPHPPGIAMIARALKIEDNSL
jgi:hypothetical protein